MQQTISGTFIYDIPTRTFRIQGDFADPIMPIFHVQTVQENQIGEWQDIPTAHEVGLTFVKDGHDFVLTDVAIFE